MMGENKIPIPRIERGGGRTASDGLNLGVVHPSTQDN